MPTYMVITIRTRQTELEEGVHLLFVPALTIANITVWVTMYDGHVAITVEDFFAGGDDGVAHVDGRWWFVYIFM